MLTGPKISSGVEKRDIRYSKLCASLKANFNRRAIILLATPGGPNKMILSPAKAANKARAISDSFSYIPLFISLRRTTILSFIIYKFNPYLILKIENTTFIFDSVGILYKPIPSSKRYVNFLLTKVT